jgi:hypothetical protein
MTETTKCPNGHKIRLNPAKHQNREKYCPRCRAVVANPRFSLMDLLKSTFQSLKLQRKHETRSKFIDRMRADGLSDHEISIRLEKQMGSESR